MKDNNNYSVYTHKVVTDDNGPMWYVGVTRQKLCRRWGPSRYKGKSLWPYIEQYGWENIEHRVIFDGLEREIALKLEDFLIQMYRSADCCINRNRSGLISEDRNAYARHLITEKYSSDQEWAENQRRNMRRYMRDRYTTKEGKIYYRVANFNRLHPDRAIETPKEARDKYLESGYIPTYIKHTDIN